MEIVDLKLFHNDGKNSPTRKGFAQTNENAVYNARVIEATHSLCGFDREDETTLGVIQYCHDAASGVVDNIAADGTYTELTSQTHFADNETVLADRTFIQYHSSDQQSFSYWYQGTLVEVTGIKTLQLPDDNNENYVEYTAAGELAVATNGQLAIVSGTLVTLLVSNTTSGNFWFADERHGIVMDGQTHLNIHMTRKFSWVNDCDLTGLENNGTTFTAVGSGRCGDEDVPMAYVEMTTAPYLYVDTEGHWDIGGADDNKLAHFVESKVVYNPLTDGIGALTEIDNDYIVMTMLLTNNKKHPIVKLLGQTLYASRSVARDHLYAGLHEIEDEGLPSNEIRPLGSWIVHSEASGQIEKGADEEIWIDHRRGYPVARF